MHVEPGPSGRDSKDQRGLQETNGMAGGQSVKARTTREHIDGFDLTDDEKDQMIMRDINCDANKADTLRQIVNDYTVGYTDAFTASSDPANYMYGDRPAETQMVSDALLKMPYYDGDMYRAIEIDGSAIDNFIDYMQQNHVEAWGFGGRLLGDTDNFYFWEAGDPRDAGVLASFTSDRNLALDWGKVKTAGNVYYGSNPQQTTVIFHVTGNKTAPSITHLSGQGIDEYEVLSPHLQQFSFDGVETSWAHLKSGGMHRIITIHMTDKGIKPADKGPVR